MKGTRKTVLDRIKTAGEHGITQTELAKAVGRSNSAILRLGVKLEAEGLVIIKRLVRGDPYRLMVFYYDPQALKAAAERKRICDAAARAFLNGDMTAAEAGAAVAAWKTQNANGHAVSPFPGGVYATNFLSSPRRSLPVF